MLLPTLRDTGLARNQRRDVLIADLGRKQTEDRKCKAEGRPSRALRLVLQSRHCYAYATLTLLVHDQAHLRAI